MGLVAVGNGATGGTIAKFNEWVSPGSICINQEADANFAAARFMGEVAVSVLPIPGPQAIALAARGSTRIVPAAREAPALIRARDVRFTQDSAGAAFKDGRSVFNLADNMAATGRAPNSMPAIRIFKKDGNIHSLDNRRLFAGQYADIDLPYQWATPADVAARNQTQIFGGTSIVIRMGGGVKAWWQP